MKKYITAFMIFTGLSLGLSSCLKETSHPPLYGWGTSNVISFQDNGGADGSGTSYAAVPTTPYPLYSFSFASPLTNDTAGFDAIVIYGPDPAPEDITVNLEINTDALTEFNNANGTSYVVPSDNAIYSFPSSVVIKKGESQAKAHVVITTTSSFDYSLSYALPLTITSATGATISSNFSTEINSFVIQNKYAGNYDATGYFYHPSAPRTFSLTANLITVDPNTVAIPLGDLGSSGYYALVNIDPTTNALSITSGTAGVDMYPLDALPTSNPGYAAQWDQSSQCNNTYDPSTGTFYLRIGYLGSSGWRVSEEILTPQ